MNTHCAICSGVSKCPGEIEVIQAKVLWAENPAPYTPAEKPGATPEHIKKRRTLFLVNPPAGYRVLKVGSKQAGRILAHTGITPMWVSQCTYAFYIKEEET
ncbi:MAG: hypothetical protein QXZ51_05660 [Candidatus Bathyarchaeia archaeon]